MSIDLVEQIKMQEERYIGFLKNLVELESPTGHKQLVDRLIDFIYPFLIEQKCSVTRIPRQKYGDFLLAEWGEGRDRILLLGHVDTVWPAGTIKEFPFTIKERIAYGPAVYDMKCGIMQFLFALKFMNDYGLRSKHKVLLLINSDEEIGSPDSEPLIKEVALKSKYVLVGEGALSETGRLKTERSGVGLFELKIKGIAAHAGSDPEKGASAIHEFARQVGYLESIADPASGTTINVGTVQGGTRPNVVAENLAASIDVRFKTAGEAERIAALLKNLHPFDPRTQIEVSGQINRLPMERTEGNTRLFQKVKNIARSLNLALEEGSTGGMSDANITSALGIPTLDGLGAVGGGLHARHEHLYLDHIPMRIALLVKILTEID